MEQTKALNALEPFIALSKTATSPRAAADLIERATSAPNTYVFAELLRAPALRALAASHPEALRPHLALLRAFSHGDYATYVATPSLPPLGDAQRLKLRQLSLLSLAASGRREDLTYARLRARLGLASAAELETLVATAIDAGLVDAKLDPARQRVRVTRRGGGGGVAVREQLARRAAAAASGRRTTNVLDSAAGTTKGALAEAMDLDAPLPTADDGKKRAGKRKM
ncbi:COP9 signalosome subunit 7 (CsnG) [Cordyceps fumosorosea ARSEF 2679]|uniref:COP9 signalosome subunit 7 (CsnG) n=1 Tax=Cordyceps fumosorosea (strain ARSEF 2679) TaxID=1081104 RepID=A0A162MSH7_CORFA|nr:COP9 signalosome subunit 7 (CsnG) [Cordyceps fumosorosea ARSEF 2679]OAA69599.1 COP9 signalosome subunit 7 (CsnG) [Cordyceps fumosorosea ARSEF 2679]